MIIYERYKLWMWENLDIPVRSQDKLSQIAYWKKKKKDKSKATLPNPWALQTESLLHTPSFTMSDGVHNKLWKVWSDSRPISIHLYMSTIQRWTHTYAYIQSITYNPIGGYFCSYVKCHCSTFYLVDTVFVYDFKYIHHILYVYSICFPPHKKMHYILRRQCLQVCWLEMGDDI